MFGNTSNTNTGGGLFGNTNTNNTGGSLFGNNTNNQTQQAQQSVPGMFYRDLTVDYGTVRGQEFTKGPKNDDFLVLTSHTKGLSKCPKMDVKR